MTITSKNTAEGLVAIDKSYADQYYLTIDGERPTGTFADPMNSEMEARMAFRTLCNQIEHNAMMRGAE